MMIPRKYAVAKAIKVLVQLRVPSDRVPDKLSWAFDMRVQSAKSADKQQFNARLRYSSSGPCYCKDYVCRKPLCCKCH